MTINTVKFSQFVLPNLSNTTNTLVGVSSPAGGINYQAGFPLTWVSATRPTTPANGTLGYNVSLSQYEYWNGAAWVQLSAGGSGTVNPGAQNQVAWYATTGTAISGLLNFANSVLVTNAGTVPSLSTILPASLTIPIPIITGVTDGSDAAAGNVGEIISSQINVGSAISLTSNVTANVTSLSLSAGDYDIWANIGFQPNAATTTNYVAGGISLVSATLSDVATVSFSSWSAGTILSQDTSIIAPYRRVSTSVPITVYLCANSVFATNVMMAVGGIFARRVR